MVEFLEYVHQEITEVDIRIAQTASDNKRSEVD